ncbi:MAG: protein phosphatase 2C domain-containing protein [Chloroflexota bacterium]|nr:protein phosphatase 2C domain-containing protein [Chloroflexota bacterium]
MNVFRRLRKHPDSDSTPQGGIGDAAGDMKEKPDTAPLKLNVEGTTRPLPTDDTPAYTSEHLSFAQASDVGIVRTNNQDAAASFFATLSSAENRPDFGIFVIADGMGGHHDGEKASAIAARTVLAELTRRVYLPLLSMDEEQRPQITEAINDAILLANDAVINLVPEGGTTLTACVIVGDFAYFGHVGDSRAYIIHQGQAEQITRDHSYVQRLYELGNLDSNELSNHPQKNVLYRALGQPEMQEVDVTWRRLPANSALLLCSDGLWGQVRDNELVKALAAHVEPPTVCRELIAQANLNGGIDNVSVILVRIPG